MLKLRKIVLGAGILLLSLQGCKKEYTCGFSYYYNPAYVAFKGFSADELRLVVVSRYTGNDGFRNLLGTDSIDASAALFEGDTAYRADKFGFFTIAGNVDFKIEFPKTGEEFRITDIRQFEADETWVQDDPCGHGAQTPRIRSYGCKVDGLEYTPLGRNGSNFYIYLSHQ